MCRGSVDAGDGWRQGEVTHYPGSLELQPPWRISSQLQPCVVHFKHTDHPGHTPSDRESWGEGPADEGFQMILEVATP